MAEYTPETPWQIAADGSLVYNLKRTGWFKGKPVMTNDTAISIQAPGTIRLSLATIIKNTLNKEFPCQDQQ